MELMEHAERELRAAGYFDEDSDYAGKLGPSVMRLVEEFCDEGHSGFSAGIAMHLFQKVASYGLLTPLEDPMKTGEFHDVSEYSGVPPMTMLQCTRLSSVFSEDGGLTWYDLDKKLPWIRRKLGQHRAYITFPYTQNT